MEAPGTEVNDFLALINQIASERDNNQREKLESNLMSTLSSPRMMIILRTVVTDKKYISVHMIMATLLKTYVKTKLSIKGITVDERAAVLEEIINLVFDQLVGPEVKEILADSIKLVLIKSDSTRWLTPAHDMENLLRKRAVEQILRMMSTPNIKKDGYVGGLICIEAVISTLANIITAGDFYKEYREWIHELGQRLFHVLESEFNMQLNTNPDQEELFQSAKILQYYCSCIYNLLHRLISSTCHSMIGHFLGDTTTNIPELLGKIFDLSVTKGKPNIYAVTPSIELDTAFNLAKENIIATYHISLKYLRKPQQGPQSQVSTKRFFEHLRRRVQSMIESMYDLYKQPDFSPARLDDREPLESTLTMSMKLLCNVSEEQSFYTMFSQCANKFFTDVIMINLITQEHELDLFKNNEAEFCELFHDLCFEQRSKSLKGYSMKLAENLSEKIDPFFTFCFGAIIGLSETILSGKTLVESKNPGVVELSNSKFDQLTDNEKKLDVCLLFIASTSFYVILREERFEELRLLIDKYADTLLNSTPLIVCRVFLIAAFLFENLMGFEDSRAGATKIFQAIYSSLDPHSQVPAAVRYQAISTLMFIVGTQKSRSLIMGFREKLLQDSSQLILTTTYEKYFDVVLKMFISEFSEVCITNPEILFEIIKALVARILHELASPTDQYKKNLYMFKCWNILRAICENNGFIPRYLNQIDEFLLPVLTLVAEQRNLEFEDDVLQILISTINIAHQVSPNLLKIIHLFPLLAQKFDYKAAQLYTAYNTLLQHAPQVFSESSVIDGMIEVASKAMDISRKTSQDFDDLYMTEGVMILHLAIQHLHANLTEKQWLTIFQVAAEQIALKSDVLENYYKSRLYGVFLSALFCCPVLAITYLVNTNSLASLVEIIVNHCAYFITTYDRKLLVLGLLSLFREKFKEQQVDNIAMNCLQSAALTLHIQRIEQNHQVGFYKSVVAKTNDDAGDIQLYEAILYKFREVAGINTEDDDDENDDQYAADNDDSHGQEEMELLNALMSKRGKAKISLRNFKSPIQKVNEYDFFIEIIRGVKATLGDANFAKLLEQMSSYSREALLGAVSCQQITTLDNKKREIEVARKIAKVKRPRKFEESH